MEQLETELVVRPIHNAQKKTYEYRIIEVPATVAEEQLSRPDAERNFIWQGVRYANQEEKDAYYNKPVQQEEKKRGRPSKSE